MIYFLKSGDHIKVGYTKNENTFETRLQTYNSSNPFTIEIINLFEGGVKEERNILNYFIQYHCKGEWFYYADEIIKYAKNPFKLPDSKFEKPLHRGNKIITENLEEILKLYEEGMSLRELQNKFKVSRRRLIKYIPDDIRRKKNEWFKLRRREINPKNIPITCITTGEEFISIAEASRLLNISQSCIWRVCNGKRKHAKNLVFKYNV